MSETKQESYAWQRFYPEQIRTWNGSIITIVQPPFYEPEQWTAVQYEEDGSVLAYKPMRKPEQEA